VHLDFKRYTVATRPDNLATVEHVIPVTRGGGHTWENVVLACWRCNRTKNARDLDAWLEEVGGADPRRADSEGEPRSGVA
jgi:5-methylcytosine-specific restriction endonuclease McrA